MSEKDEASPEQRVTMEQRWDDARKDCAAGSCDPAYRFHAKGCERRAEYRAIRKGQQSGLLMLAESMDVPPEVLDIDGANHYAALMPQSPQVDENWGDTPVATKQPHSDDSAEIWGVPVDHTNARGWCAPSRCALGTCHAAMEHERGCPNTGIPDTVYSGLKWEDTVAPAGMLELPEVKVKRGGICWPVTRLEWVVKVRRRGLFGRAYSVGWRVLGTTGGTNWIDGFRTAEDADNAVQQLDRINLEINRRRDQIDDAAAR